MIAARCKTSVSKLIVAVGDIHGEFDMLRDLMCQTAEWLSGRDAEFVFVGDYIDRGPKSKEVLDFLRTLSDTFNSNVTLLQGNHEDWMVQAVLNGNRDARDSWLHFGGIQTRASYGVLMPTALTAAFNKVERADATWLKDMPLFYQTENHVFVHGGLRPGVPMAGQSRDMMQWARPADFSDYKQDDPLGPCKHLVFGHTPSKDRQPWLGKNWTGIDTGACFPRGALSAAIFDRDVKGGPMHIVRVERPHPIDTI